jgi:trigger factor
LDIQLQKQTPLQGIISIRLQESDYAYLVEDKLRDYAKRTQIKGFRPGHVPLSLLKKLHAPSLKFEVITTLLSDTLAEYLQTSNLNIVGQPLPDAECMQKIDWDKQQAFEFQYHIGWIEAYQVDLTQPLQLTAYQVKQIGTETLDAIIDKFRKNLGANQLVAKSEVGDIIHGTLHHPQLSDPSIIALPVVKTQAENPEHLIGLQNKAQIQVDIKKLAEQGIQPIGMSEKELQALMTLEPPFELKVTKVERIIPAELNQAFFDKVLGTNAADSIDAFRDQLQHIVLQNKQQEANQVLNQHIKKNLLEATPIHLPDDFLTRWLQYKQPSLNGKNLEVYYKAYAAELRWDLVVQKIVENHNLTLEDSTLIEELKKRFKAAYTIPDTDIDQVVQSFLQENKGENYKQFYTELLHEKVYTLIKAHSKISVQDISVEEFNKLSY